MFLQNCLADHKLSAKALLKRAAVPEDLNTNYLWRNFYLHLDVSIATLFPSIHACSDSLTQTALVFLTL